MRTLFHYVFRIVLAVGAIIGAGKLAKYHDRVTIDANDQSVDQIQFPSGTYSVNATMSPNEYQQNDLVAFFIPGQPDPKVAHVIATEGQTVEFVGPAVVVDGKQLKYPIGANLKMPPCKIPHGCTYLLCDKPYYGQDSSGLGPIPSYAIYGKLKY